ncbi:DUF4276 family protein [Rubrivirga sp.]|uniref:DUF4276 family protein n=1 Tax=Rubrivirga sp. TaxID=1885344 RepID=UPI003B5180CD
MPRLLAVVEGRGEEVAVPRLLTRAVHRIGKHDWVVPERLTMRVGGLPAFRAHLGRNAEALRRQPVDAALVLLDLDDGCPAEEGPKLADNLRGYGLPFPVAVVLARREYEAWFLASLPSIAAETTDLPEDAHYPGEPEKPRDCKAPLRALMPQGRRYDPVLHQAAFTSALDFDVAAERCRSFRRLLNAVDEVTTATAPVVTPDRR